MWKPKLTTSDRTRCDWVQVRWNRLNRGVKNHPSDKPSYQMQHFYASALLCAGAGHEKPGRSRVMRDVTVGRPGDFAGPLSGVSGSAVRSASRPQQGQAPGGPAVRRPDRP